MKCPNCGTPILFTDVFGPENAEVLPCRHIVAPEKVVETLDETRRELSAVPRGGRR